MSAPDPSEIAVMDLVGGPQGSGKSSFFAVANRGYDSFNVDDHRKRLNGGSSQDVPAAIRAQALVDYQAFIDTHISDQKSFSIEVTLAKEITFVQARKAWREGFRIQLVYVAAAIDECLRRVAGRIHLGGHGVPPETIRDTYVASMKNLPRAIREFQVVQVYDNSRPAQIEDRDESIAPIMVLEAHMGAITVKGNNPPSWLLEALSSTEFHF